MCILDLDRGKKLRHRPTHSAPWPGTEAPAVQSLAPRRWGQNNGHNEVNMEKSIKSWQMETFGVAFCRKGCQGKIIESLFA